MRLLKFPLDIIFDPRAAKHILTHWEVIQKRTIFYRVSYKTIRKIVGDQLKINIGCGDGWHHEGWLGLDYAGGGVYPKKKDAKSGFDIDWDVLRGLPFKSETLDAIFMSHILEHFTYNESLFVLNECYRVLKPKGRIRIVVPDLDLYISRYLARDETFFRVPLIAGSRWLGNLTDTFLANFYSDPALNNTCHKYAYSFENLSYRLRQCGFRTIERSGHMTSKWSEFNHPDFDSANPRVPSFSLYVEAEC